MTIKVFSIIIVTELLICFDRLLGKKVYAVFIELDNAVWLTGMVDKTCRIVWYVAVDRQFLRYFKKILSRIFFDLFSGRGLSFVFNYAHTFRNRLDGKEAASAAGAFYSYRVAIGCEF